MSISERKERERAERYERIVAVAAELAEAEGWEAVTTRRLAGLIEYSQPVLYSHFKGKAEIMGAVGIKGFEDLAAQLKLSRTTAADERDILGRVCATYLDFAQVCPVIYEAMFVLPTGVQFAGEETPTPLREAFSELVAALGPNRDTPDILAEVLWSALHGMAILARSGRIPQREADIRLTVLVQTFS